MTHTRINWTFVVRALLLKLQMNGIHLLSVDDGDGEPQNIKRFGEEPLKASRIHASEMITAVDSSTLMVMHGNVMAWLSINLCVDPEEILSDWRVRQDTELAKLLEKVSTEFSAQWEGKPVPTEVVP